MRLGINMMPGENPPIYIGNDIYILHVNGENIEVVMKDNRKEGSSKYSDNPFRIYWDILSISPLSSDKVDTKEIVDLIQEAMEVYGESGVGQYERYPMKKGLTLDIQVRYRGEN